MSTKSWAESLQKTITTLKESQSKRQVEGGQPGEKRPLRVAILGIGHELRGDDAAGLVIAQRLQPIAHPNLLVIEAGHAPENHTGLLRRFNPDLIILIDSAQLNEPPGAIRWLSWQETTGLSASSHTIPPYMLANYLTAELNCEIALIGIQPANTGLGSSLSQQVEEAVKEIEEILVIAR